MGGGGGDGGGVPGAYGWVNSSRGIIPATKGYQGPLCWPPGMTKEDIVERNHRDFDARMDPGTMWTIKGEAPHGLILTPEGLRQAPEG